MTKRSNKHQVEMVKAMDSLGKLLSATQRQDKKAVKETGVKLAKSASDLAVTELFIIGHKIQEFVKAMMGEAKARIEPTLDKHPDLYELAEDSYGVKVTIKAGAEQADYEVDPVYKQLKSDLAERKSILDAARKLEPGKRIFDDDGAEVPRVPIKSIGAHQVTLNY